MASTDAWRNCFHNWPAELPRRGVVVTPFDEQIPFENFLVGPHMVLLERRTPDTIGARKVIIPYENILAVKFTDVLKTSQFHALGFEPEHGRPAAPRPGG